MNFKSKGVFIIRKGKLIKKEVKRWYTL
jgi:hypothetical protein